MPYKKYDDTVKADTLKKVLEYCLTEGQKKSKTLGYIPLPDAVATKVLAALGNIQSGGAAVPAGGDSTKDKDDAQAAEPTK